jgi:hypothetical protein
MQARPILTAVIEYYAVPYGSQAARPGGTLMSATGKFGG